MQKRQNLSNWRINKWKQHAGSKSFYYMLPIANLNSVLKYGILSRKTISDNDSNFSDFSIQRIQTRRSNIEVELSDKSKKRLHELVPLFLNKNNATIKTRDKQLDNNKLCILEIDYKVIGDQEVELVFSYGNAVYDKNFCRNLEELKNFNMKIATLDSPPGNYWDFKNERMSELLIYPKVNPAYIKNIHLIDKSYLPENYDVEFNVIEEKELFI